MSRLVDEDVHHIKTKAASKEYRDNWDRIFGEDPCPVCGATDHEKVATVLGEIRACPDMPVDKVISVITRIPRDNDALEASRTDPDAYAFKPDPGVIIHTPPDPELKAFITKQPAQGTDEIEIRYVVPVWYCSVCDAKVLDPENHRYHATVKITE